MFSTHQQSQHIHYVLSLFHLSILSHRLSNHATVLMFRQAECPRFPVLKKYVIQCVCQRFKRPGAHLWLQLTLPHRDTMPPHFREPVLFFLVALPVALYLVLPEINICLGQTEIPAILMTMPETSVHKNNSPVFSQYNIGMTGQTGMVEPIAEATAEKEFPHQQFRLRIFSAYCSHIAMALFFGQLIHNSTMKQKTHIMTDMTYNPFLCLLPHFIPTHNSYPHHINEQHTTLFFIHRTPYIYSSSMKAYCASYLVAGVNVFLVE